MGRTTRSAVAIFLVNQYEVEWFPKIENIFGRKHVPFLCRGIVKGVSPKLKDFILFFIFSGKKFPGVSLST